MANMSKSEMVAALVERDVAKWGEAERVALVARHAKKSTNLLKMETLELQGEIAAADALIKATTTSKVRIATGAADHGVS